MVALQWKLAILSLGLQCYTSEIESLIGRVVTTFGKTAYNIIGADKFCLVDSVL